MSAGEAMGAPGRWQTAATACASFSLAGAISGWVFLVFTWGFSSLVAPFGLVAGIAGLWGPKKLVAAFGVVLNSLLAVVLVDWLPLVDVLPGFPTD